MKWTLVFQNRRYPDFPAISDSILLLTDKIIRK